MGLIFRMAGLMLAAFALTTTALAIDCIGILGHCLRERHMPYEKIYNICMD